MTRTLAQTTGGGEGLVSKHRCTRQTSMASHSDEDRTMPMGLPMGQGEDEEEEVQVLDVELVAAGNDGARGHWGQAPLHSLPLASTAEKNPMHESSDDAEAALGDDDEVDGDNEADGSQRLNAAEAGGSARTARMSERIKSLTYVYEGGSLNGPGSRESADDDDDDDDIGPRRARTVSSVPPPSVLIGELEDDLHAELESDGEEEDGQEEGKGSKDGGHVAARPAAKEREEDGGGTMNWRASVQAEHRMKSSSIASIELSNLGEDVELPVEGIGYSHERGVSSAWVATEAVPLHEARNVLGLERPRFPGLGAGGEASGGAEARGVGDAGILSALSAR